MLGLVVASYGKRYDVEIKSGQILSCVTRGKKTDIAAGDQVELNLTSESQAVIEHILPRSSLLYRSNAYKSKLLAANVTQVVIVLATQPSFYEALLNRCLIAAEVENILPLIVLNKCDLPNTNAMDRLKFYASLGYRTLSISAKQSIEPLRAFLNHHRSVLVGQSGMGKSTIINQLLPLACAKTQEVSIVLDSGKHTTTSAKLYSLNETSSLIDSPGLQEFGLQHIQQQQLELAFREFRPFLGHCKYNNCKHLHEPGCAVLSAVKQGEISQERLLSYQTISQELSSPTMLA